MMRPIPKFKADDRVRRKRDGKEGVVVEAHGPYEDLTVVQPGSPPVELPEIWLYDVKFDDNGRPDPCKEEELEKI